MNTIALLEIGILAGVFWILWATFYRADPPAAAPRRTEASSRPERRMPWWAWVVIIGVAAIFNGPNRTEVVIVATAVKVVLLTLSAFGLQWLVRKSRGAQ